MLLMFFLLIASTSFICLDENFAIFTESEKDVGFLQRTWPSWREGAIKISSWEKNTNLSLDFLPRKTISKLIVRLQNIFSPENFFCGIIMISVI